ncbi:hypothetical protein BBO99_00005265 [Phytophthora kernoviae]|uniref:Uncharacterized protein n=1 Tax=Phytophthora kernoviae TaxID=325452 RepID=A0A421GP19_9STRA|nr:hypothetical protein JM16_004840 [Phytophthora kernoviae]KAG2524756.1 hypothetical protein JM18_005266 [Phytophthora kernoviae]RLN06516.1 hypothetical protein BBI17_004598 [Phytophthora kernoviae]RLN79425.1 hypothetical protein BBO99_00005265 [Phytophthora kernoviae]
MPTPKVEKTVHGDLAAPPSVDANGIVIGAWSHPVIPEEPESFLASNCSIEACCPCLPLAQIERISLLRSNVRERFDIPGSMREDRTAAWQETARSIRQMRRHLLIDKVSCREAVNTLPAYVV